jgi:hypothetical protein
MSDTSCTPIFGLLGPSLGALTVSGSLTTPFGPFEDNRIHSDGLGSPEPSRVYSLTKNIKQKTSCEGPTNG